MPCRAQITRSANSQEELPAHSLSLESVNVPPDQLRCGIQARWTLLVLPLAGEQQVVLQWPFAGGCGTSNAGGGSTPTPPQRISPGLSFLCHHWHGSYHPLLTEEPAVALQWAESLSAMQPCSGSSGDGMALGFSGVWCFIGQGPSLPNSLCTLLGGEKLPWRVMRSSVWLLDRCSCWGWSGNCHLLSCCWAPGQSSPSRPPVPFMELLEKWGLKFSGSFVIIITVFHSESW